jgi:thiamine-phosphate pyrophosphorylase
VWTNRLKYPITYLITEGILTDDAFPENASDVLAKIEQAVTAGISLIQIREKQLSAINVFTLGYGAAKLAKGSDTKILINDRADIAAAAGADGVQLTENSLPTTVIRESFPGLMIGVSTHSPESVAAAAEAGADFALFGPVFETPDKDVQGIDKLRLACDIRREFPVLAIGGIDESNLRQVFDAGAGGFAAIRFLNNVEKLKGIRDLLTEVYT